MKEFVLVALGGALGSMTRYSFTLLGNMLPLSALWSTMAANICGAFLIGWATSALQGSTWMVFMTVGVCGGFTTFSTFSSQTFKLLENGQYTMAMGYVLLSVALCVIFVFLGLNFGRINL